MNVRDLRDLLEDVDDDVEVMVAHQPSWPLAERLGGVVDSEDITHEDTDEDECQACERHVLAPECGLEDSTHVTEDEYNAAREEQNGPHTIWLVAGGHDYDRSPYAPKAVFETAGVF